MESLKKIMELIDANNKHIPEGDYIDICIAMKNVHANIKKTDICIHTQDYYDLERGLTKTTLQIENLYKKYDQLQQRSKITRAMKREAIREFLFEEGIHTPVDYTQETLTGLGFKDVNYRELYDKYLERYNIDIFMKKKEVLLEIQDKREVRDDIVLSMSEII